MHPQRNLQAFTTMAVNKNHLFEHNDLRGEGGGGRGELLYIGIRDVPFLRVLLRLENKCLGLFRSF